MTRLLNAPRIGRTALRTASAAMLLAALLTFTLTPLLAQQQPNPNVRPPPGASVPGGPAASDPTRPGNYDVEMWQKLRRGVEGKVEAVTAGGIEVSASRPIGPGATAHNEVYLRTKAARMGHRLVSDTNLPGPSAPARERTNS